MHACIPGRRVALTVWNIWSYAFHYRPTWDCLTMRILLWYYSCCVHNGLFLFLQGLFTTPGIFRKILTTLFHSWGFPFSIVVEQDFWRRIQSYQRNFSQCQFTCELLKLFFCLILSAIPAIVAGILIVWPLSWWRLCGILFVTQFPMMTMDKKLLARTDLRLQATSREVWSLTSVFIIYW